MNSKFLIEIISTVHGLYTWNILFYLEIHQYIYLLFHVAVKFFVTLREEYNLHTIFLSENMERGNLWELDIQSLSSVSDLSTATVTRPLSHTWASCATPLLWQLVCSIDVRMILSRIKMFKEVVNLTVP